MANIKGTRKRDTLDGTSGDDTILGLGGNDTIVTKGGDDLIKAGTGNDKVVISSGSSADIKTQAGDDTVNIRAGTLGSDINLGSGADTVNIAVSTLEGQTFHIVGGGGVDTINFIGELALYEVTKGEDGVQTVVDENGNTYIIATSDTLTFNGIPYSEPTAPQNQAPVVADPIDDQTAKEGKAFSFVVPTGTFTDTDSASLTYSATLENGAALPSWLTFDVATRTFSGTPGENDSGNIAVRVTASDGSLTASDVFSISVEDAPFPAPSIVGGILKLNEDADYDVIEAKDAGVVVVKVHGSTYTFDADDIQSVDTHGAASVDIDTRGWTKRDIDGDVNFTNVTITPASAAGPFESSFEAGGFDVTGQATINGSMADYFKAAWDYLDDHYSYYDEAINSFGIDLGIKYALYLKAGGEPLTDYAKFQANSDADGIPQRAQMLHDNLLGNLHESSIADKFSEGIAGDTSSLYTPEQIYQRIIDAGLGDFLGELGDFSDGRSIYGGYESQIDGPEHNAVRAFDYAQGFDRPDYIFFDSNGTVDSEAVDVDDEMYFGNGNSPENFVIGQHEGAGIETALKVHFRTGDDILPVLTTPDGVVNFIVPEGYQVNGVGNASSTHTGRAAWSFDYSLVAGLNGSALGMDDFDIELKVDMNSGIGVDYQVFDLQNLGPGNTPFASAFGGFGDDDGTNPNIAQNSGNFGFGFLKDHIDDGDGYTFGKGTFDIELVAYKDGTDEVLSSVHIRVVVDSDQFVI